MAIKELKKIIVTDDDEDILQITQVTLEIMQDVQIKYCHSGQETIQEALRFQPDLIILDVMMPDMDGLATLQVMHMMPALAQIPVVFMTARARKEEVEDYKKRGVIDVIIKPFDPLTLEETIRTIWQNYQKADSLYQREFKN